MPIQKLAKEAKKTRLVFLLEVILILTIIEAIDKLRVAEEVLQANCTDLSLELEQTKAQKKTGLQEILTGLLLYNKKVVILDSYNNLQTYLLQQIHSTIAIAHPSRNKIKTILKRFYQQLNQDSNTN